MSYYWKSSQSLAGRPLGRLHRISNTKRTAYQPGLTEYRLFKCLVTLREYGGFWYYFSLSLNIRGERVGCFFFLADAKISS